jgi:hypothetical protein
MQSRHLVTSLIVGGALGGSLVFWGLTNRDATDAAKPSAPSAQMASVDTVRSESQNESASPVRTAPPSKILDELRQPIGDIGQASMSKPPIPAIYTLDGGLDVAMHQARLNLQSAMYSEAVEAEQAGDFDAAIKHYSDMVNSVLVTPSMKEYARTRLSWQYIVKGDPAAAYAIRQQIDYSNRNDERMRISNAKMDAKYLGSLGDRSGYDRMIELEPERAFYWGARWADKIADVHEKADERLRLFDKHVDDATVDREELLLLVNNLMFDLKRGRRSSDAARVGRKVIHRFADYESYKVPQILRNTMRAAKAVQDYQTALDCAYILMRPSVSKLRPDLAEYDRAYATRVIETYDADGDGRAD